MHAAFVVTRQILAGPGSPLEIQFLTSMKEKEHFVV